MRPVRSLSIKHALPRDLQHLQTRSFKYFEKETDPDTGLVRDKDIADWPASIAATGLALAAYPVAVERDLMSKEAAIERTLATLKFFEKSPQSTEPDATGYRGFYYHFLDMPTGRRAWQCEVSTVDTAFLLAGMLTAAAYFADDTPEQRRIRDLARFAVRTRGLGVGTDSEWNPWSWVEARDGLSSASVGRL